MQTGKPDKEVTGNVSMIFNGLLDGKPVTLTLPSCRPTTT